MIKIATNLIKALMIFSIIAICSCNSNNSSSYESADLAGKWEIIGAERNGRAISTLRNGYFEFTGDQKMRTNIMADDSFNAFLLNGTEISQQGGENLKLIIQKLSGDTLILSSVINKDKFYFGMVKQD